MKKKIVVIEDDQAILDLVIYNLQKNGFQTEGFTNPHHLNLFPTNLQRLPTPKVNTFQPV